MKTIVSLLESNPQVSDYKINTSKKESYEIFFVKGKLETVRCTDTTDQQVTVYADHDEFKGDSQFYIYPSTTEEEIAGKISDAVQNALLMNNQTYELPAKETGDFTVISNFENERMTDLSARIADTVFSANILENGSLNAVEIFINKYTDTVQNSRGLCKTQHRYTAMVEAIPTYNGSEQSVELYEQYNFNNLDTALLCNEIAGKMAEVKARYEAKKPDFAMNCKVVLNKLELADLFNSIASDLNYSAVYSHSNLFSKGDSIQKELTGDPLTIMMKGTEKGNACSTAFDADGLSLGEITLVQDGVVMNYYGSNRFGQYLNETPTGILPCISVAPGTLKAEALANEPYLEVISMSGLQVDFFSDYIGGEIRLAYYHDGEKMQPVTGISISGKLSEALNMIQLSEEIAEHDNYTGPSKAAFSNMKIF